MKNINNHLQFVVHKHDATSLHFDLRLQVDNIMPSWAVPKGPTLDNTRKRLAMRTPDHALSYKDFEGVLPEGSYGAGPVMIWDEGYYYPEIEEEKGKRKVITDLREAVSIMKEGIKKGEFKFELHGKKLKGSFALVKTRGFGGKNAWLLIKHKDEYVEKNFDAKDEQYDYSVRSDKSIRDI